VIRESAAGAKWARRKTSFYLFYSEKAYGISLR
jgi:hypothetical protein